MKTGKMMAGVLAAALAVSAAVMPAMAEGNMDSATGVTTVAMAGGRGNGQQNRMPGNGNRNQQPGNEIRGRQPGNGKQNQQPGTGTQDQQPGSGTQNQQPGTGAQDQQPGNGAQNQQPGTGTQDTFRGKDRRGGHGMKGGQGIDLRALVDQKVIDEETLQKIEEYMKNRKNSELVSELVEAGILTQEQADAINALTAAPADTSTAPADAPAAPAAPESDPAADGTNL